MGARKFTAHEGLNPALPGPLRVSPRQQRVIRCAAQPRRRTTTLLVLGMRSMVWWRWEGGLTVLPCRVYVVLCVSTLRRPKSYWTGGRSDNWALRCVVACVPPPLALLVACRGHAVVCRRSPCDGSSRSVRRPCLRQSSPPLQSPSVPTGRTHGDALHSTLARRLRP